MIVPEPIGLPPGTWPRPATRGPRLHGGRLAARAARAAPQATPRRVSRDSSSDRARAEPALDGAHRPLELSRGRLVGLAFQIAQHDRCAVLQGQPIDLLVDDPPQFRVISRTLRPASSTPRPSRSRCPRRAEPSVPAGDPHGHSVQPRRNGLPRAELGSPEPD